jgi:hypothetical protein
MVIKVSLTIITRTYLEIRKSVFLHDFCHLPPTVQPSASKSVNNKRAV